MTADTVGGVWTYALDLADALAPLGVEVEVATMGRPLDHDQRATLARSAVAALHESAFALEVPLRADLGSGSNWAEAVPSGH